MPFDLDQSWVETQFPQFDVISRLTPSAHKAAYHVREKISGGEYCLKVIAPNHQGSRFDREIDAMHKFDHPNVVKLVEYAFKSTRDEKIHYVIEEFITGSDLTAALGTGWHCRRVKTVFGHIFQGLEVIGKADIVHRDLKPSNIRLRNDDTAVIIDFGVARHLNLTDLTETEDGAAIGTVPYFAPEQFQGNKYDIDPRTDLFAAGIILYQALLGTHPFWQGEMTWDQLKEVVCTSNAHLETEAFQKIPRRWQLLIGKLLEKQRALRFASAKQAATILEKCED